jgi:hypothetical protein
MNDDDSKNSESTNTPTMMGGKHIPCPGCGGPLEDNYEGGGSYRCPDCDWEWETWEVLDSMRDK